MQPEQKEPVTVTLRLPADVYELANGAAVARRVRGEKVGDGASILAVVCDAVRQTYGTEEGR